MGTRQGFVKALDGERLHWAGWGLDAPARRPTVVLVHGYGEHIKRYDELATYLAREGGLAVVGIDVRGHGQSSGERGHVDRYDGYLVDVAAAFDVAHRLRPEGPRVLLGHSNGGLIALRYALGECGRRPDALVLSGPLLKLAMAVPQWKATLGVGLSKVIPALAMPNDLSAELLSHDKAVVDAYVSDPMVHRVATARYFTEMTAAREDALVRAPKLRLPTLVMQGGEDGIVSPEGARELIKRLKHDDVTYIEYEGLYHEIFNELDRARVFADLGAWLMERGLWAEGGEDAAMQHGALDHDTAQGMSPPEDDTDASDEGDTSADAQDAAAIAQDEAAAAEDEAAAATDEAAAAEDEAAAAADEAAAAEDEAAAAADEAAAAEDEAAAGEGDDEGDDA